MSEVSDALLTVQDREEALSKVYAHAVAASAGYVTAVFDYDRDGVDMEIRAGGYMRPGIGLQLKATINLSDSGERYFNFPLKRSNYDQLRVPTQTPRLLVVLDLPKDENQWITITEEELVLRHCAYWVSLKGHKETINVSSVTVQIPKINVFNVDSLRMLMEQSRGGIIR